MKSKIVAAAVALFLVVAATPASAAPKNVKVDVKALTERTATMLAGDSAWIEIAWEALGGPAEDFKVTVKKLDSSWEVRYPEKTSTYASLWTDSTLSDGEIDFTAINVTAPYSARKSVQLHLEATYAVDGKSHKDNLNLTIPIAQYTGNDLSQADDSASVDGSGWIQVPFVGSAPRLDGFEMTAKAPADILLAYPGEGSFSSLAHDARLEDGESDFAALFVDATGAAPGSYEIPLHVTYTKGSAEGMWDGSVTITVP
ncbi:MAG: hypothetical protein WAM81_12580 [Acidimicrobiia bacterium]